MLINIHTHHANESENGIFSLENIIYTQNNSPNITAPISVGVHPWYLENEINWDDFEAFAQSKNVMAIGECGLDKAIKTPVEEQMRVFIQQIRIAERLQKPVIVHCVRAYNEVLSVLKQEKPSVPLILHGFNKNLQVATPFFAYNVYFSFGINILKENFDGGILKAIFKQNKLFLETDNAKDIRIQDVYECAAQHLGIDVGDLEMAIEENFGRCFWTGL
jgi:TatD DNase family protein